MNMKKKYRLLQSVTATGLEILLNDAATKGYTTSGPLVVTSYIATTTHHADYNASGSSDDKHQTNFLYSQLVTTK